MLEKILKYKEFFTPAAIIIAALIIAGGMMYSPIQKQSAESSGTAKKGSTADQPSSGDTDASKISITDKDHIRGNRNAAVTIVEFSDLECPFCKRFHATLKQALQEYPEKVRWVYKHFPIDQLHPKARKEAEATECANELGGDTKFWEYTDRVYELTPSNNQLDAALLPKIAEEVGLNRAQFESCLNSGKYAAYVEENYQEGVKLGVEGTPSSFVNGVPIRGAVPYAQVKSVIDSQLK